MSMARERCCLTVALAIPLDVEFSFWTGVGPWGWPMSFKVFQITSLSFVLTKRAHSSSLASEEAMCLRIPLGLSMAPFFVSGLLSLF